MATKKSATAAPSAAVPADHTHVKVVAKRAGFRRAGRAFGDDAVYIPLDELGEGELEQLLSEPMLVAMTVAGVPEASAG